MLFNPTHLAALELATGFTLGTDASKWPVGTSEALKTMAELAPNVLRLDPSVQDLASMWTIYLRNKLEENRRR